MKGALKLLNVLGVAAGLAWLPLVAGCTWYRAPQLEMKEITIAEETEEGIVLAFALDATNPNKVALPLKTVRYSLELDGKRVFSGERSAEATLRRRGTQEIRLPVAFAWAPGELERPLVGVPYTLRGELKYVTPGQLAAVLFDTGVRQPAVGFRKEGVMALEAPPAPAP